MSLLDVAFQPLSTPRTQTSWLNVAELSLAGRCNLRTLECWVPSLSDWTWNTISMAARCSHISDEL